MEEAQTITTLEATADTLSLPLTMATYTAGLLMVGIGGVGLVLVGEDPDKTVVFVK